jgi:hypothetical protein
MSSLNYPPVARMNATRTTEPYHPVHVEGEQKLAIKFRAAACEVVCGLHLAAGVFMMLFVDVAEQWPLLLLAILYCFLGGSFFGVMASVERYAEEIEGGEER